MAANAAKPTVIHSKNGCSAMRSSLGVLKHWMPNQRSSRSVRRERPELAQDGGAAIATTAGSRAWTSAGRPSGRARRWVSTIARSEPSATRSSPLRTPTSIPSARTGGLRGPRAVSQELEEVAAGQHAERATGLRDEHGGAALELAERDLDRVVRLDHRDRRAHDLGDVGLERVGVAEDAIQERALLDRGDDLRDVRRGLAHDRRLRDAVLLEDVDRLADLVPTGDRHERRHTAVLGREHLLDPHDLGPIEEPGLEH